MECRNCGAKYQGLTCPVCGHKQLKKAQCSVCFTTLYPGQEYCPKCGNPTIYRKKTEVTKMTNDTATHSQSVHHHYYTFGESYDYKKDAYDYREDQPKLSMNFTSIFDPLRKNRIHYQTTKPEKQPSVPGIVILIFALILFSIISSMIFGNQNVPFFLRYFM